MYAVVRRNSFDPERLGRGKDALREFDEIHAAQTGYAGTIVIDEEHGRRLVVNLWEDRKYATAALPTVRPAVARLIQPLLIRPSELVAMGEILATDVAGVSSRHAPQDLGSQGPTRPRRT